jgi:hypothetical protein
MEQVSPSLFCEEPAYHPFTLQKLAALLPPIHPHIDLTSGHQVPVSGLDRKVIPETDILRVTTGMLLPVDSGSRSNLAHGRPRSASGSSKPPRWSLASRQVTRGSSNGVTAGWEGSVIDHRGYRSDRRAWAPSVPGGRRPTQGIILLG